MKSPLPNLWLLSELTSLVFFIKKISFSIPVDFSKTLTTNLELTSRSKVISIKAFSFGKGGKLSK